MCCLSILRNGNVSCLCHLSIYPCHMSYLRNGDVSFHYMFYPLSHVPESNVACRILEEALSPCRIQDSRAIPQVPILSLSITLISHKL